MLQANVRRLSHSPRMAMYDIVISGGGMVGTAMALALGKNPVFRDRRIALIESSSEKSRTKTSSHYSNRVSAINPASRDLFRELGAWDRMSRRCQVTNMKVWGSYTDDVINYEHGKDVAYIIENDDIVAASSEELSRLDNVDVLYGTKITGIVSSNESDDYVVLKNGDRCGFKLLIGADGTNSEVRKTMGVQYLTYDYNQMGIVATLNIMEQENSTAWQRFLPSGPVALLPLNNKMSSLVWSTTREHAKSLLNSSPESFVDAVNDAFRSKPVEDVTVSLMTSALQGCFKPRQAPSGYPHVMSVAESSRACFPLGFGHASNYVRPKMAIVGDAAHRVHPLAGQGVNLGFRDVHNMNHHLTRGLLAGRALGDIYDLKSYEQDSQRANVPIMIAIDLIYRVYTSDFSLVKALGTLGIRFTEGLSPIKNVMRSVASS